MTLEEHLKNLDTHPHRTTTTTDLENAFIVMEEYMVDSGPQQWQLTVNFDNTCEVTILT